MEKRDNKDKYIEEISISEIKSEDFSLFDQTDKPFLILYLFIFIFGIIITILSV